LSAHGENPAGCVWRYVKAIVLALSLVVSALIISASVNSSVSPYLSWFALVPLFLAIGKLKPAIAALSGAFWGVCIYFFSVTADVSYIRPTLLSFGLLAAIPALYTTLGALLTGKIGFNPLVLAIGWIGVEFALRPLGLDNGLLAGTQGQNIVIQQVGRLLGYVFVAFLVAAANASILTVLSNFRLKITFQKRDFINLASCEKRHISQGFFPSLLVAEILQPRGPPYAFSRHSIR
jgi:apolipoprotein N-acyltransferase